MTVRKIQRSGMQLLSSALLLGTLTFEGKASSLEIVSSGFGEVPADGASATLFSHVMSTDGRYVLFRSQATNLLSEPDTNNYADIYLRDRMLGTTELISVDGIGNLASEGADIASMTPDARYIAFQSASTYVLPDDNFASDVFVRDRLFGSITRVSVNSNGDQAEPFHAVSGLPDISADGRYVVFSSTASNLVDGDTNGDSDVFVHDLVLGTTTRVSVSSEGVQAHGSSLQPHISADGRYVVFRSTASDLVEGSGPNQIFVRDLVGQTTELASKSTSGVPANGNSMTATLSGDGRYVIFASDATNLVTENLGFIQIYRHDRLTGTTILVSTNSLGEVGNHFSQSPATTTNGRYVVFESLASNLVNADTNNSWDSFWHDCDTGATRRISTDASGTQGFGDSQIAAISDDADFVAFTSRSTNWNLNGGTYDIQGYSVFFAPLSLFADGFEN